MHPFPGMTLADTVTHRLIDMLVSFATAYLEDSFDFYDRRPSSFDQSVLVGPASSGFPSNH